MNGARPVPTYNERENLPLLVEGVLAHAGTRILVLDDGSPDGTGRGRRRAGARASRPRSR